MTTVKYSPAAHLMRIEGHAGTAPAGQDIVCAAASILSWTLVAAAQDRPEFGAQLYINESDGVIEVDLRPREEADEVLCKYLCDTIWTGFELLNESYPDNIKLRKGV